MRVSTSGSGWGWALWKMGLEDTRLLVDASCPQVPSLVILLFNLHGNIYLASYLWSDEFRARDTGEENGRERLQHSVAGGRLPRDERQSAQRCSPASSQKRGQRQGTESLWVLVVQSNCQNQGTDMCNKTSVVRRWSFTWGQSAAYDIAFDSLKQLFDHR